MTWLDYFKELEATLARPADLAAPEMKEVELLPTEIRPDPIAAVRYAISTNQGGFFPLGISTEKNAATLAALECLTQILNTYQPLSQKAETLKTEIENLKKPLLPVIVPTPPAATDERSAATPAATESRFWSYFKKSPSATAAAAAEPFQSTEERKQEPAKDPPPGDLGNVESSTPRS